MSFCRANDSRSWSFAASMYVNRQTSIQTKNIIWTGDYVFGWNNNCLLSWTSWRLDIATVLQTNSKQTFSRLKWKIYLNLRDFLLFLLERSSTHNFTPDKKIIWRGLSSLKPRVFIKMSFGRLKRKIIICGQRWINGGGRLTMKILVSALNLLSLISIADYWRSLSSENSWLNFCRLIFLPNF